MNSELKNDALQKQENEQQHSQSKNTEIRLLTLNVCSQNFQLSQEMTQNQKLKPLLKNGNMRLNASERRKSIQM